MTKKLRVLLYVVGVYLALFGLLLVFAPGAFERITRSTLGDAQLTLLYGQYTLTFAIVSFMAAKEKEAAGKLSLTVLLVTVGNAIVFGYLLMAGKEGFSQGGPPFIVNVVLTVLLFFFRKQACPASHDPQSPPFRLRDG